MDAYNKNAQFCLFIYTYRRLWQFYKLKKAGNECHDHGNTFNELMKCIAVGLKDYNIVLIGSPLKWAKEII